MTARDCFIVPTKVPKNYKGARRKSTYRKAAVVVAICLLFSCLGIAQTGGTISGSASDATGALIPGASVTVRNVDTGLTREVMSDEQGRYTAPNLPVGSYEVQVSLSGFRTEIR